MYTHTITYVYIHARACTHTHTLLKSVRLFECISTTLNGQISVKFDRGDVYENMSRKHRFV